MIGLLPFLAFFFSVIFGFKYPKTSVYSILISATVQFLRN